MRHGTFFRERRFMGIFMFLDDRMCDICKVGPQKDSASTRPEKRLFDSGIPMRRSHCNIVGRKSKYEPEGSL